MSEVRLIDADELKKAVEKWFVNDRYYHPLEKPNNMSESGIKTLIDNAPTVEPEELKRVRDICEHWNDNSSSFVSACNAFEDILHIFKMGVGDIRGEEE